MSRARIATLVTLVLLARGGAAAEVVVPDEGAAATQSAPSPTPAADWLTAPYPPERDNLWVPTIETIAAFVVVLGGTMINPEFSNTSPPSIDNFVSAFTNPPTFSDGDNGLINYIFHPEMGAEIYLLVRNRSYSPWAGFAYSSVASVAWEYLFEGWVEQPSAIDLAITSTAGSLFGEARYQLRQYLIEQPASTWRDVGIVLADGIEAFHRWVAPPEVTPITHDGVPDSCGPAPRPEPTTGLALTLRF
ncbi:MAG: DUF3943 domain-containing protein [Deltaproteobacteria bacterium]|nr:DUF3943 domain-containing protein [Deltaproteobacteria bacterium]